MSDLTDAREYAQWMAGGPHRANCPAWQFVPNYVCNCNPPDAAERRMWQTIADELDAYLDHKAANADSELPL